MDRLFTRVAVSMAMLLMVVLVASAAVLCLGAAGYLALREALSPSLAALVTGLGALLFALAIGLVGRAVLAHLRDAPGRRHTATGEAELASLLGKELAALIRGHPPASTLASLVAGFVVGMSPGLRRLLRDLLKG